MWSTGAPHRRGQPPIRFLGVQNFPLAGNFFHSHWLFTSTTPSALDLTKAASTGFYLHLRQSTEHGHRRGRWLGASDARTTDHRGCFQCFAIAFSFFSFFLNSFNTPIKNMHASQARKLILIELIHQLPFLSFSISPTHRMYPRYRPRRVLALSCLYRPSLIFNSPYSTTLHCLYSLWYCNSTTGPAPLTWFRDHGPLVRAHCFIFAPPASNTLNNRPLRSPHDSGTLPRPRPSRHRLPRAVPFRRLPRPVPGPR